MTADASGADRRAAGADGHGRHHAARATCSSAPFVDARRTALNTNDLRGKVLRIKVDADGSLHEPARATCSPTGHGGKTRPEIYAMGFRNPFRIQVDSDDVAYITDYSPDSQVPEQFRGPAGTGRVEVVRKPANYGWPLCYTPDLPYYRVGLQHVARRSTARRSRTSATTRAHGPGQHLALEHRASHGYDARRSPSPDIWYSYRDNQTRRSGTPCLAYYDRARGGTVPAALPGARSRGGVGPHGAAPYDYDPDNPSATKFPPYYDGAIFFGEFTP